MAKEIFFEKYEDINGHLVDAALWVSLQNSSDMIRVPTSEMSRASAGAVTSDND